MAKNNKKLLPKNMSVDQASEFWDEHSLFEYADTEEVSVNFDLKKKRYVGIDRKTFKKIETQARRQKTSIEALLERWIAEKC